MKLPRRHFLHLAAGAAALPAVSRLARAQAYPTRPVRLIVGFPAGGRNDILARLMGQWLAQRLGQQFVVDNRPGAAGNIATEAVVRAPPTATRCCWSVRRMRSARRSTRARLQFPARHRAGRGHHPRAAGDGGASVGSGHERCRVHRPRQDRSCQDQDGLDRQRQLAARVGRTVQDDDRRRSCRSCITPAAGPR